MAEAFAYVANTNTLELNGLKSEVEGIFINDATVTVTIKDSAGVEVTGQGWPLLLDYVDGTDGNYRTALTHNLNLLNGKKYTAFIDADGSTSDLELYGHWEFIFTAQARKT